MKSVSDMNLSWICGDEYYGVQMYGEKLPGGFYSSVDDHIISTSHSPVHPEPAIRYDMWVV